MASDGYLDPDELFKDEDEGDDESDTYSKCSDEFCDKRSWCDGNHSYSLKTLKSRCWGILADLPSDDERWLSRPPLDEVTSDLRPLSLPSPEKKPWFPPKCLL
ncbi:hypothetical protein BVRB_5g117460 [Beta vulgaris subsp. vulgaris]|nr:hypothetical protein BVRB_5g117460 [Beta vulgaris subsp. vulgaris]